jgi:peptidoglycan/LPS O-acetylase OafA/YrhL
MVIAGFVIFPLLKKMLGEIPNETHSPSFYLFFISNFQLIQKGFADSSILNVLWSVGIEEQFYILWPLLLSITPKKYLVHLFTVLFICTITFRYFNIEDGKVIYYHTISVFSDMVMGGLAAYLIFYNKRFLEFISNLPKKSITIT